MAGALPAQENASGTLTLNGSRIALTFVYAIAQPGFFNKASEDIRLLFSDRPLQDDDRADVFRLIRLARTRGANIVEVVVDAGGEPLTGAIYAEPFSGMASVAGMHRFERRRLDRQVVAGRMFMQAPSEFADVKFQYEVEFTATIPRPPTREEVARALASPPGLAATAYVAAIRRGSFDTFVNSLAGEAADGYRGAPGAARFAALSRDMPRDSAVVGLTVTSDTTATATIQGHEKGRVIE